MAKKEKRTILILDDDLGFAMWLGRALTDAGFRALPAIKSEEAIAIAAQTRPARVDLFIANFTIAGSRELLEKLAAQRQPMKVIGIGGSGSLAVDARISRPRGKNLPSPDRYVKTVQRLLQ